MLSHLKDGENGITNAPSWHGISCGKKWHQYGRRAVAAWRKIIAVTSQHRQLISIYLGKCETKQKQETVWQSGRYGVDENGARYAWRRGKLSGRRQAKWRERRGK